LLWPYLLGVSGIGDLGNDLLAAQVARATKPKANAKTENVFSDQG
jgi:hypothetical protein